MMYHDPFSRESTVIQNLCVNHDRLPPRARFLGSLKVLVIVSLAAFVPLVSVAEEPTHSLKTIIDRVSPSVVTIRVQGRDGDEIGIGTGFIVDSQGLVATNFHVITEGRPFTVQTAAGEMLEVLSVEASDVNRDLALVRVQVGTSELSALAFADDNASDQGTRVLAFGNPHGMRNSVVEGIISAKQTVDGMELLQMAMPVEPGNSGGPLVDLSGRVHGIVNMKSAIDDNLGFAIPIQELDQLIESPNPVTIGRWVKRGEIDSSRWTSLFGALWQDRGGRITASGLGKGFGGRALLLSTEAAPKLPFEIGVSVKLDDESGAAGLAFHSDGNNKHYGFYPSNGRMRLTCFRGASVYSWDVLRDVETEHYLPGQWNDLKVRVEAGKINCYVNGQLVIESKDRQLSDGSVGLTKFRGTRPEFKRFRVGTELPSRTLSQSAAAWLSKMETPKLPLDEIGAAEIRDLGESGELASRELVRQARELEKQAERLRGLAKEVQRSGTIEQLSQLVSLDSDVKLLRGALLIATLDHPDLDLEAYVFRVDEMAGEIADSYSADATASERRTALHRYLFEENGFHGSRNEYYHPANSHLNRVIDDREGLPITLSVLYMELARRLDLIIEGVGMPGHFIVRDVSIEDEPQLIDVFERGMRLSDDEARLAVERYTGRPLQKNDLRANTSEEILSRMLNNLIGIAARNEDSESMLRYLDAIVAIKPEDGQMRLMRAQLRALKERDQAALEELDWMLEHEEELSNFNQRAIERLRNAILNR